MQIPEGFYRVESLNPNSSYHLSMRLNYPNEFDVAKAIVDGRTELGSDIFIHGSVASIGCIAIGDPAIEEVFVLAALTGVDAVTVIIVPVDFRVRELPDGNSLPPWSEELYGPLREAVRGLPGADG
jgi:murein L,D-transpeptidase YafK